MRERFLSVRNLVTVPIMVSLGLLIFVAGFYLSPDYKLQAQLFYLFIGLPFLLFSWRELWALWSSSLLFKVVVIFLIYSTLSAYWTYGEPRKASSKALFYLLYMLSFVWSVAKVGVFSEAKARVFSLVLALAALTSLIWSVLDSYFVQGFVFSERLENTASKENLNYYSHALGWAAVYFFSRSVFFGGQKEKLLNVLVAMALMVGCVLSQSKATLVGVVVALLAMLFWDNLASLAKKILVTALISAFLCVLVVWDVGIVARFEALLNVQDMARYEIYSLLLDDLKESQSMLFGRGLFVDTNAATGGFGYPHSVYMSTLYSSGAVGLLLLVGLLACSAYSASRMWRDPRAKSALGLLLYGALTLVFDGFWMLDHININWLLIWLPCAFLIGLEYRGVLCVESDRGKRDLPS